MIDLVYRKVTCDKCGSDEVEHYKKDPIVVQEITMSQAIHQGPTCDLMLRRDTWVYHCKKCDYKLEHLV